jgi:hypothetical protein
MRRNSIPPVKKENHTTQPFSISLPRTIIATASKISLMTYHFQKLPQTKDPLINESPRSKYESVKHILALARVRHVALFPTLRVPPGAISAAEAPRKITRTARGSADRI